MKSFISSRSDFLATVLRTAAGLFFLGLSMYAYIDKENEVTRLKLKIPEITKQTVLLSEENTRLRYQIDQFERPEHLMQLCRQSSFAHLKHPFIVDVSLFAAGQALPIDLSEGHHRNKDQTSQALSLAAILSSSRYDHTR